MRHRVKSHQFNRDTNHRKALLKNLVRSLIEKGEIVTTQAKAKETQRLTDKLINKAKKNSIASRRLLHRFFGQRNIVNTLVEKIIPAIGKRQSGFTSIKPVGKRRGDNTQIFKIKFVDEVKTGTLKSGKKYKTKKTASPKSKTKSKKTIKTKK